jgi:hypothetical protein
MAGGPATPQQMAGIWATASTRLSSGATALAGGPVNLDTTALEAAKRHRAELLENVQRFGRALGEPIGELGWRERVRDRLGLLRGAFRDHIVVTEGTEGLYGELLDHSPRLARRVHSLVREHAALMTAINVLGTRMAEPAHAPEQIRGWGSDLVRSLHRHRQRGADLVYEAYAADIGGET